MKMTVDEELVVGIFHHPDLHHPSGGGREEEWAESQQGNPPLFSPGGSSLFSP